MVIETARLILRPFQKEDAADVFEYLHEPAVNCFKEMSLVTFQDAEKEMLKREPEKEYYFAIVEKKSNKVIGEIDAFPEQSDSHNPKSPYDTFSPCWMLNAQFQGRGYALEAAQAFFDYLFTKKNARRIYAFTEDYNQASQKLCIKLGMRKEGEFKEFVTFVNNPDGSAKYENTIQFAVLRKEWETQKRN